MRKTMIVILITISTKKIRRLKKPSSLSLILYNRFVRLILNADALNLRVIDTVVPPEHLYKSFRVESPSYRKSSHQTSIQNLTGLDLGFVKSRSKGEVVNLGFCKCLAHSCDSNDAIFSQFELDLIQKRIDWGFGTNFGGGLHKLIGA